MNYPGNPEKSQQSGDKGKHFPLPDILVSKRALGEYYADNEKDNRFHQLKKLHPRNIIYKFYFSQTVEDRLKLHPDNNQTEYKLCRKVHFFLNHAKIVIDNSMRK